MWASAYAGIPKKFWENSPMDIEAWLCWPCWPVAGRIVWWANVSLSLLHSHSRIPPSQSPPANYCFPKCALLVVPPKVSLHLLQVINVWVNSSACGEVHDNIQDVCPLSKMLGTRSIPDLGIFWTLEYPHCLCRLNIVVWKAKIWKAPPVKLALLPL